MTYGFTLVPYGRITYVIPQLISYLVKSEVVAHGRSSVDDIVRFLYTGQMLLWVMFEKETENPIGFTITEIKQYPQKKMLVWQYAAGENVIPDEVDRLVNETIEKFASDMKCDGLELVGRFGWKQKAKVHGYVPYAVAYEKFLQ